MQTTWTPTWRADVKRELDIRHWGYKELAKAAGLGVSQTAKYVGGFYCNDNPKGAIERALGMR